MTIFLFNRFPDSNLQRIEIVLDLFERLPSGELVDRCRFQYRRRVTHLLESENASRAGKRVRKELDLFERLR